MVLTPSETCVLRRPASWHRLSSRCVPHFCTPMLLTPRLWTCFSEVQVVAQHRLASSEAGFLKHLVSTVRGGWRLLLSFNLVHHQGAVAMYLSILYFVLIVIDHNDLFGGELRPVGESSMRARTRSEQPYRSHDGSLLPSLLRTGILRFESDEDGRRDRGPKIAVCDTLAD